MKKLVKAKVNDKDLKAKVNNKDLKAKVKDKDLKVKASGPKKSLKDRITIRFQLIAAFMVPIACIIILGLVSFQLASKAIEKSYENSTSQTINMTGEYLSFGLNSVDATSHQYANDEKCQKLYVGLYKGADFSTNYVSVQKTLLNKTVTDSLIQNIYIISDSVKSIVATNAFTLDKGLYQGYLDSEQGKYLQGNKLGTLWVSSSEYLDKPLGSNYALRIIRHVASAPALLIIDIKKDAINKILSNVNFDKHGFLALVTSDGKEIIVQDNTADKTTVDANANPIFIGEKFYQDAVDKDATSGTSYVNYKGQSYLFMYSKIGTTGAMICALMPKSVIASQAGSIQGWTIIIVIIAIILASGTVFFISQSIVKIIHDIIQRLRQAATGDLTVKFKSRRSDEFHILIEEIQTTFTNMKDLILHVNGLSTEVSSSSVNVTKNSEVLLKSSQDISSAMAEIEQGVTHQAKDAEECLIQMDNLSKKIELVSENTKEIGQIADKTMMSIKEGTLTTENLNNQTQSTIVITTSIIDEIEKLDEKSVSISNIVDVINEIANQTNLLSLNASIEAARAGESGKGFAVVASEIRKLAEQSQNSVNNIKKIIDSIQDDTKKAVGTAKKAENVLKLQGNAVKATTDSYKNIYDSVEKLMVFLNYITQNVGNIEEARTSTLGAIESISAVLEEIVASANTVNQTTNDQLASVETLNKEAGILNQNADILVEEVNKFKVE